MMPKGELVLGIVIGILLVILGINIVKLIEERNGNKKVEYYMRSSNDSILIINKDLKSGDTILLKIK